LPVSPALDRPEGCIENRIFALSETLCMTSAATAASPQVPDAAGRFGEFGGRYVPETLTRALDELTAEYDQARQDPLFTTQLNELFVHYAGPPRPLYLP